jgi:hypothetical protein
MPKNSESDITCTLKRFILVQMWQPEPSYALKLRGKRVKTPLFSCPFLRQ